MFNKTLIAAFVLAVIATVFIYANIAKADDVVTDGLVSYWTFDRIDITGKTAEDVWGDNDGTIEGNPEIVEGKVGEALSFGEDNYVDCGNDDSLALEDEITIEAWIKINRMPVAYSYYFIGKKAGTNYPGDYLFNLNRNTKLRPHINLGGAWVWLDGNTSYEANTWFHAAFTYDGSEVTVYLNGAPDGSKEASGTISTSDRPVFIATSDNFASWVDGTIDEVRIYNRGLSENEIKQNFAAEGLAIASPSDKLATTWGRVKAQ